MLTTITVRINMLGSEPAKALKDLQGVLDAAYAAGNIEGYTTQTYTDEKGRRKLTVRRSIP